LEVSAYIKRIVHLYIHAATANIATGTVTEDWTRKKKQVAHHLEYIVERVLVQKLRSGESFKSELTLDIDTYQKEYLKNARQEFFDKTQWLPPEGNFEKIYIPMMETCIECIHRIYCLYQIDNITNADLRDHGLDDDTLSLILTVQRVAQDRVQTLLEPLEPKNLKQAVAILDSIEKEYERMLVNSAAAENDSSQSNPVPTKISLTRFLTVNGAFAIELDKREKLDEDEALRNIGTLTKRGLAVAADAVGTASSLATFGALYLSEKAMDVFTGPVENEKVRLHRLQKAAGYDTEDEDESEEDYYDEAEVIDDQEATTGSPDDMPVATKLQSTPPPSYEKLIDWEYETDSNATKRPYSPRTSTALVSSNVDQNIRKTDAQKIELN